MERVPLIFRLHFDSSVLFDKEPEKDYHIIIQGFLGIDKFKGDLLIYIVNRQWIEYL